MFSSLFHVKSNEQLSPAEIEIVKAIEKEILEDEGDEEADYDPYSERKVIHPTTYFATLMNLLKSIIGTGIYSMPLAFSYAGLLTGSLLTIFTALICTHCAYILLRCTHELCRKTRKSSMSFPEVIETACLEGPKWAKPMAIYMKHSMSVVIFLAYFGTCSVYTVIVAENCEQVIHYHFNVDYDIRIYIALLVVPCIMLCWVPTLKFIAPFSIVANLFMFVGLGITFYYCFTDMPAITERPIAASVQKVSSFFGIAIFSMEAIGVILPLENKMKKPKQMVGVFGVLNMGMIFVTVLYGFIGFIGYVKYGDNIKGSITLNLNIEDELAQAVKILIAIAVFLSIGIQFYVLIEIAWNAIEKHIRRKQTLMKYILRTLLATATVALAIAVPLIGPFVSLIGAFCFSILGLLAPVTIEVIICWDKGYGKWNWIIIKNVFIGIFGLLALFWGSTDALEDIFNLYAVKNS